MVPSECLWRRKAIQRLGHPECEHTSSIAKNGGYFLKDDKKLV